jgi:hypothetical protein
MILHTEPGLSVYLTRDGRGGFILEVLEEPTSPEVYQFETFPAALAAYNNVMREAWRKRNDGDT